MTAPLNDVAYINLTTTGGVMDDPTTITLTVPGTSSVMTVNVPGIQGPPGVFRLGSVITGAPGTDASATTSTDDTGVQTVVFTIPRGDTGNAGSLTMGSVTTLAAGSLASATITGTPGNQTLTLSIPQGATGPAGPTGATGAQGPQGIQGLQGPQGPAGTDGKDGAGVQIAGSVANYAALPTNLTSADAGKAYLNNADGLLYVWSGTSFPANGSGTQFVGPAGPANTLTIGTVTTGTAGSSAAASVTGAAPNQSLNLTIPTGATGAQGTPGPANQLSIGTVTTGAAGSQAAATISGSSPAQSLNLTIPTGAQGPAGQNGNGVLVLGASDPVPAGTSANTVIYRPAVKTAAFYWGQGTTLPSTGIGAGDTYFHTGLNGLLRYNGTSWRHLGPVTVADANTRTTMSANYSGILYAGFQARQTDTGATYEWNGSAWTLLWLDSLLANAEWTYIGATGAPAFQNSWVNYSSGVSPTYTQARFTKVNGIVYVEGLVMNGTLGATAAVFTLPAGYRPAASLLFNTVSASSTALILSRIDVVGTTGNVIADAGGNAYFSLNCSFPAEQ